MNKWHRIPKIFKPAVILLAAYNYAFENPELYSQTNTPYMPIEIYHFMFFDLMETTGGDWYFKVLVTDSGKSQNCN